MPEAPIWGDVIEGNHDIAVEIWGDAEKWRRVHRLADKRTKNGFPVFRFAGHLCVRRGQLRAWLERIEQN